MLDTIAYLFGQELVQGALPLLFQSGQVGKGCVNGRLQVLSADS